MYFHSYRDELFNNVVEVPLPLFMTPSVEARIESEVISDMRDRLAFLVEMFSAGEFLAQRRASLPANHHDL
jgi:hypothetical protein